MQSVYKLQYKFNALHKTESGDVHAHTFIAIIYLKSKYNKNFATIENHLESIINEYDNAKLFEWDVFSNDSSLEAICKYMFSQIQEVTEEHSIELLQMELGDNPISLYGLTNKEIF